MADNRSSYIQAMSAVFFAFTFISVSLRCYRRLFKLNQSISQMVYCAFCTCPITGMLYGVAQRTPTKKFDEAVALKLCELMYGLSIPLTKLAAGVLLLQITTENLHIWTPYVCMAISLAAGFIGLVVVLIQCSPPSKFWNKQVMAHCIDIEITIAVTYACSVFSTISDFTTGLLQLFILRKCQMKRMEKIALMCIIGLACIASVAVIGRIPYVARFRQPARLPLSTAGIAIWSKVKVGLEISAGCIATLRPCFRAALSLNTN
ncbi:hypothetical protein BGW36DRAFT_300515 [Talaromyces proteolyticus]|uniref:Rhodopsin domain-containing protein n=1 Tax=Talaromyces proteolyticus TaxID=1131652 RepID=A0AAD4KNK6_9EURO|nr:uncharacterized protein BGW36DRAFT_300515 [Talaromyces proteolyticus]KAH8694310.1 hypothetical protein BGW36DRAFT_300515 [Talaromyces proteolyticus]